MTKSDDILNNIHHGFRIERCEIGGRDLESKPEDLNEVRTSKLTRSERKKREFEGEEEIERREVGVGKSCSSDIIFYQIARGR